MSSSIGSYTLKVTPEKLQECAADLHSQIKRIDTAFNDIESRIKSTSNYWRGDAADAYRKDFSQEKSVIEEMITRMSEHAKALDSIAAKYTGNEKIVTQIAESLPTDIIK